MRKSPHRLLVEALEDRQVLSTLSLMPAVPLLSQAVASANSLVSTNSTAPGLLHASTNGQAQGQALLGGTLGGTLGSLGLSSPGLLNVLKMDALVLDLERAAGSLLGGVLSSGTGLQVELSVAPLLTLDTTVQSAGSGMLLGTRTNLGLGNAAGIPLTVQLTTPQTPLTTPVPAQPPGTVPPPSVTPGTLLPPATGPTGSTAESPPLAAQTFPFTQTIQQTGQATTLPPPTGPTGAQRTETAPVNESAPTLRPSPVVGDDTTSNGNVVGPQNLDELEDAAPFGTTPLEDALRRFLNQMTEVPAQVTGWLAGTQLWSWLLMGLAVTATAEELLRRRWRRVSERGDRAAREAGKQLSWLPGPGEPRQGS